MIAVVGVDHLWHHARVPVHHALDTFVTSLVQGEEFIYYLSPTEQQFKLLNDVHLPTWLQIYRTKKYIEALTSKTKPAKVLVCMIYYPDENNAPSWANASLGALGYNQNPAKIQLLIRKFYEEATRCDEYELCAYHRTFLKFLTLNFVAFSLPAVQSAYQAQKWCPYHFFILSMDREAAIMLLEWSRLHRAERKWLNYY